MYKGVDDETKRTVAIKVLDLCAIEKESDPKVKEILRRLCKTESQLMVICSSQNVVECLDVYENSSLKIIVMEYCRGGDLQQ